MGEKADAVRAELRAARIKIDRMKVAHAYELNTLVAKVDRLEEVNEALREQVQIVAQGGKGAVL